MAIYVNENGNTKDLGVRSNLDWNGIEYLGEQPCRDSLTAAPVFDLPRPLSDYKYMILFGHMDNGGSYTELCAGILVFSPADVNHHSYNNRITVSFMQGNTGSRYITITDLAALQLTTFKEGSTNSYQRLYGIY